MAGMFLLFGLCVLPAGLVVAMIVKEARARYHYRRRPETFAHFHPTARRARSQDVLETAYAGRTARAHTPRLTNYIAPGEFVNAAFEFTIRRHPAARRRPVVDQGGFAQVPILIHDRHGTSFLTHRKVCLN